MSERTDLLERYAAEGQGLGVRPGVAILSFWQGVFEIVYRIVALVSPNISLPSLTPRIRCYLARSIVVVS